MNNEIDNTTKDEILSAINSFATSVDQRFDKVDQRFDKVDQRLDKVEQRLDKVEQKLDNMDGRVGNLENQMVTKDYLDRRMADLGAEIGARIERNKQKEKDFRLAVIDIFRRGAFPSQEEITKLEELA